MPKKKILWVVYDFVQAGGERYVFEICKGINKNKFDVDIIHLSPLGSETAWASEYYYHPSIDTGCKIFELNDVLEKNKMPEKTLFQRAIRFFKKKIGLPVKYHTSNSDFIAQLLDGYDFVNFSGTEVYSSLCIQRKIRPGNAIIHILTAQFQSNKDLYEGFDKNLSYHFVSSLAEKSQRLDLIGFENYQLTYFPLCFQTNPYSLNFHKEEKESFKIAVFTRLSAMKPLDPYFYALKILLEQGINVQLEVYGAGDPDKLGLIRQLKYLYLSGKVFFKGHTESIESTLKQNPYDLIWFQSNNSVPAGYAALEITMSALPQIFWDFAFVKEEGNLNEIFPSFTSLIEFVSFTKKLLDEPGLRKTLGERQRNYVLANNSIRENIHVLEEIFEQ